MWTARVLVFDGMPVCFPQTPRLLAPNWIGHWSCPYSWFGRRHSNNRHGVAGAVISMLGSSSSSFFFWVCVCGYTYIHVTAPQVQNCVSIFLV